MKSDLTKPMLAVLTIVIALFVTKPDKNKALQLYRQKNQAYGLEQIVYNDYTTRYVDCYLWAELYDFNNTKLATAALGTIF